MTPEEIRKQMMGSAGVKEDDADTLYSKADTCFTNKDYSQAFIIAKQAADLGNVEALSLVGLCFENGLGVQQNFASAKENYEMAAKAGLPRGMRNFALTLVNDDYGPPDYELALHYLSRADGAGDFRAPGMLGCLFLDGLGTEKDPAKGVELFKKGIDRGCDASRYHYAICLKDGNGIEKDLKEALINASILHEKNFEGSDELVEEIKAEIDSRPASSNEEQVPTTLVDHTPKPLPNKSTMLAVVLAVVFGPFGLLYISWKRALAVFVLWAIAVALFHNPILFWIVLSTGSIVLMGTGSRKNT